VGEQTSDCLLPYPTTYTHLEPPLHIEKNVQPRLSDGRSALLMKTGVVVSRGHCCRSTNGRRRPLSHSHRRADRQTGGRGSKLDQLRVIARRRRRQIRLSTAPLGPSSSSLGDVLIATSAAAARSSRVHRGSRLIAARRVMRLARR